MQKMKVFPQTGKEHFIYTSHSPSGHVRVEARQLKTIPEIVTNHLKDSDELIRFWTRSGWVYESAFLLDFSRLDHESLEVSELMF